MSSLTQPRPLRSAAWLDRTGVWASSLCVIHCLLTPVLLSFSAVLAHFLPSEERVHRSLAVGIALIGAVSLLRGFRRHGRVQVFGYLGSGLFCICTAAWLGDMLPYHWVEVAITFVGSALMIRAHRLNHTFCMDCSCAASGGNGTASPYNGTVTEARSDAAHGRVDDGV